MNNHGSPCFLFPSHSLIIFVWPHPLIKLSRVGLQSPKLPSLYNGINYAVQVFWTKHTNNRCKSGDLSFMALPRFHRVATHYNCNRYEVRWRNCNQTIVLHRLVHQDRTHKSWWIKLLISLKHPMRASPKMTNPPQVRVGDSSQFSCRHRRTTKIVQVGGCLPQMLLRHAPGSEVNITWTNVRVKPLDGRTDRRESCAPARVCT